MMGGLRLVLQSLVALPNYRASITTFVAAGQNTPILVHTDYKVHGVVVFFFSNKKYTLQRNTMYVLIRFLLHLRAHVSRVIVPVLEIDKKISN